MGLISYFQNVYYDNRLKKADKLLYEGNLSKAESIYMSLVDKHPQAACKLADLYYSMSKAGDVKNDVSLFNKAIGLKNSGTNVYDASSYNTVLQKFSNHLKERAIICFESGSYEDCYNLTNAIKGSDAIPTDIAVLCAESKIRLLFRDITSTKVNDPYFYTLIDSFKEAWAICRNRIRAKDSSMQFCQEMIDSKRYYVSNLLFDIIINNPLDSKCLNNALNIINGNDTEASSGIVKNTASLYAKSLILQEGLSLEEAVTIFEACWKASADSMVMMDVIQSAHKVALRDAFIDEIIQKHNTYFSSTGLFKDFTKWIYGSFEGDETLKLLERVHLLGYDVEGYFTNKTHALISKLPLDKRLPYLDHAQKLFPNSIVIIEDKRLCAQQYLENNDNEKAITISDSIIGKCENAYLIKAHALLNVANIETDVDKKIELLEQSQSVLSSYHGSDAKVIEDSIIDAFILTANLLYQEKREDDAYSILKGLASYGSEEAASRIAVFRLSEIREIKSKEKKLKAISAAIDEISNFGISSLVDNKDYIALWDEKISSQIENCKDYENQTAINTYECLLKELDSIGFHAEVLKAKRGIIEKLLIEKKYLIARELESKMDLMAASNIYKEINILEARRAPTLSAIRFIICKLKMQNNSDVLEHRERIYTILRKSAAAFKAEKEDIAYRFALILLKAGDDQEALSVLAEFLPGEEYLKKACEQGAVIKALAKLEEFNNKLDSVKNKTLSSVDAISFINHMLEYADIIKPVLDLSRTTLSKYRNKLKNYAIFKLFDEERYDVAFEKMVKEHKDYLDDYTALRNIALTCLNMAEASQITDDNFKDVISIWLTAIYQEKLFVKSLDYTSWDDQYTFSLYEAYGHFDEESVGTLPDNVNIDYSEEDNNVFIKDVQRALLDRFEAAISNNQQFHEFFTLQKDAMDAFIALNLDDKCRLVAPYLAHKDDDLFQDISEALEQDREKEYDNWEDLLSVGAIYQMPQPIYTDYSKAKSYYEDCIASIDSLNANNVKQVFVSSRINLVKRFRKLSSALTSYSNSKISALSSKEKTSFKCNYDFYLVLCNSLKDKTLSFVFSNYVMQYVVGEVNSKSMKKSLAADYILSIFQLDKNNTRVKENLTTLFEMLASDKDKDSSKAVTIVLDKIRSFDATLYKQFTQINEDAKIDKELSDIVDKLTKGKSLSDSAALQKIYSLYSSNPNNDAVCEILSQLCVACIMKYIIHQESGGSSVTTILNRLKSNMSSTFKSHRGHFREAYNSIWNKLPVDAQMAIKGYNPHASLNSQGIALKVGLDYFVSLGGFPSTSPVDDIWDLKAPWLDIDNSPF